MEIASFKNGAFLIGDYYFRFRALWIELKSYMGPEPCCAKKQAKLLENQQIFELLGRVDPQYEPFGTQVISRDPLHGGCRGPGRGNGGNNRGGGPMCGNNGNGRRVRRGPPLNVGRGYGGHPKYTRDKSFLYSPWKL